MYIDEMDGEIEIFSADTISGWGVLRREDGGERSARFDLFVNDVLIFRFDAYHIRHDIFNQGKSRVMHTGFCLKHAFNPGTKIELKSSETGRLFGGKPRYVPHRGLMRVGLIAPARNEARFLIEWIAYHRVCGVEHFYIADNGGDDETSDLLCKLHAGSIVNRYDYLGRTYFQVEFYERVLSDPELNENCDLVATVDCDEFLLSTTTNSAQAVLSELFANADVSAVGMNWANYGTSHLLDHDPRRLVIEQYGWRSNKDTRLNKHAKTAFRPDRFRGFSKNVHAIDMDYGIYLAASGQLVVWDDAVVVRGITKDVDWTNLRINHYSTKSLNEFIKRKQSGRAADDARSEADRLRSDFFDMHNTNDVLDPICSDLIELTKIEIQRIKALV